MRVILNIFIFVVIVAAIFFIYREVQISKVCKNNDGKIDSGCMLDHTFGKDFIKFKKILPNEG